MHECTWKLSRPPGMFKVVVRNLNLSPCNESDDYLQIGGEAKLCGKNPLLGPFLGHEDLRIFFKAKYVPGKKRFFTLDIVDIEDQGNFLI